MTVRVFVLLASLLASPAVAQDPLSTTGRGEGNQISTTTSDEPTLRQYIELRISSLREWIDLRFAAEAEARNIGAIEVERRLVLLNGHHEALAAQQATYLPRELFEARTTRVDEEFASQAAELAELREWRANQEGRAATWSVVTIGVSLLIALAGFWLTYVRRPHESPARRGAA